ncbi:MAG: AAA family ATPase [Candidatus Hodarchaeales archaeon]
MSGEIQSRFGRGFDLLQIEVYRFMNYATPITFSFKAPNIVISGATGSGKTTILDALTFSLYGKCSRSDLSMVKTEDIVGRNGKVTCDFLVGLNLFKVSRGRNSKGKSYLELFINGERINGKIPDLNEKIRSTILGMNYDAFVNSSIIRQDEMKSLGSKSSIERLRTLQNLFRLDIFDKATKDTQVQLTNLNIHKIQIQEKLSVKEDQLLKIAVIEKEIDTLIPQLEKGEKEHNKLIQEVQVQEKEEQSSRKQYEKFQILDSKLKNVQERHQMSVSKLKAAQAELVKFKELKKVVTDLETQLETIKDINNEITELERLKKDQTSVQERISQLKRSLSREEKRLSAELSRKKTQISTAKKRIDNLHTDIDQHTAFKILNQEGRLSERIQRISIEKTWNLSEKLLDEISEDQEKARNDLSELGKEKERINEDSFKLSEILERIKDLEQEAIEIKERGKELQKISDIELSEERKKLEKVGYTQEKEKLLERLYAQNKQNVKIQQDFEKQKKLLASRIDPTSRIQTFEGQIGELRKQIRTYEDALKDFGEFREKYEKLKQDLKNKRRQAEGLQITITRQDQNIKNCKKNIKELKKIVPEVKELKLMLTKVIEEENILTKLKNEVFHIRGAPFYAINKILPRIGKRASLILSDLTNQRFTNIRLEKIDKGFEINIRTKYGVRDIATFSGGERTQINAAIRLAISEELSSLEKDDTADFSSKKTLFIDEGDLGSLDTLEAQQAFVSELFKLSSKFKIILITHLSEIADQFPNTIQIVRNAIGRSTMGDTN